MQLFRKYLSKQFPPQLEDVIGVHIVKNPLKGPLPPLLLTSPSIKAAWTSHLYPNCCQPPHKPIFKENVKEKAV